MQKWRLAQMDLTKEKVRPKLWLNHLLEKLSKLSLKGNKVKNIKVTVIIKAVDLANAEKIVNFMKIIMQIQYKKEYQYKET